MGPLRLAKCMKIKHYFSVQYILIQNLNSIMVYFLSPPPLIERIERGKKK